MGNEASRDLSRPKDRGRPTTCDLFELYVSWTPPVLVVRIQTDLPAGTTLNVLARRTFREVDGHEWYWTAIDSNYKLSPQDDSCALRLSFTNDELDTHGLNAYRQLQRSMHARIGSPPTTELAIDVVAPAGPHKFGLCNRRLTGRAVTTRKSGHSIERSFTIDVPVSPTVMARLHL